MKLEIVLESFEDFKVAADYNIDRVELVSALDLGGLTPSLVVVKELCSYRKMDVQVMIRPRPGNFFYSGFELKVMCDEIKLLADLGVKGVVFGCLNENSFIDEKSLEKLVKTAKFLNLETTFHRAFDFCKNQDLAIEILVGFEFNRILSAGSMYSVDDGYSNLESLLQKTKNKIGIIAGGGINEANILPLIDKEFESIHFSIRKKTSSVYRTSLLGENYTQDLNKISKIYSLFN